MSLKHLGSLFKMTTILCCLLATTHTYAQLEITYPNINGFKDTTFGYKALKLALDTYGVEYKLTVTEQSVTYARMRKLIEEKQITIADFSSSSGDESHLKAVYFPIDLGLSGWRLLITHKQNQQKFLYVKELADLQYAVLAQEVGWDDTKILRYNQLQVYEASSLKNLFMMAQRKRIDAIPLGLDEAHTLLRKYQLPPNKLIVENKLLLKYPIARLFFVHKQNHKLHNIVQQGLKKAFEDGSFMQLFRQHPGHRYFFNSDKLKQRRIVQLDNPFISDSVKNIDPQYFLQLEK